MNKAYKRCLFTLFTLIRLIKGAYLPDCRACGWIMGNSPGSCAKPGSDKLTEVQLYNNFF